MASVEEFSHKVIIRPITLDTKSNLTFGTACGQRVMTFYTGLPIDCPECLKLLE